MFIEGHHEKSEKSINIDEKHETTIDEGLT